MIGLGLVVGLVDVAAIGGLIARPHSIAAPGQEVFVALIFSGMLALGAFLIARALYAVTLWEDRFSIRFFGRREYRCESFVGFRRTTTPGRSGRNFKYVLVGRPGQRDVVVRLDTNFFSSADLKRFQQWASRLPDLESADLDREASETRQKRFHPEIAGAPIIGRARARKIAKALAWAEALCAVLVIAILWLRPPPYSTARTLMSMVICLLLPAAVTVKVWQPDAFQLGRAAGLRLPASLNSPFLIGGAAPLLPAFLFFPPVRWTSAIAIGLVFAAVVGYPLLRWGLRRVDRSPRDLAGTVAILLLYGYGVAITVNGAFDRVRPAVNAGTVLDRQENHGRGHSYTLTVEWKAPQTIERRIAVPREVYDRARIGDGLGVVIGRGAFRIPWIVGAFPP